ncbi:rRNA maturation RNase YbeY [Marinobacter psychrophilus]|uniref:rRNA maturation RNase YbeY n=1 Tax=Marinobacter psychrophilus TaxID=330734 RepID=UPI001B6B0FE9|nr:rRNA maturation RNase YbeY [Marinobacter psychrophilus]MBQ0763445.1 rRNA maturation RNase YbeY [Marinobacter psychrophilus]MBQ0845496.1 rRNA maturation RNase YbeY [Marinobacter psychrophilus]
MNTVTLDLQLASDAANIPSENQFRQWSQLAWQGDEPTEVTIRIVDESEMLALNFQYRGKDKPTNVLSFPFEAPAGIHIPLAGDLVICAPIVAQEAREQYKDTHAHWAHMIIHGMLHLQSYDHIDDNEAEEMEGLEIRLLAQIGITNPYDHAEVTEKDS